MEFLSGMVNSISAYMWGEEDNDTTTSPEDRIETSPTSRGKASSRGTRKRTKTSPESRKPSANSTRKSRMSMKSKSRGTKSRGTKSRGKARTRKTREDIDEDKPTWRVSTRDKNHVNIFEGEIITKNKPLSKAEIKTERSLLKNEFPNAVMDVSTYNGGNQESEGACLFLAALHLMNITGITTTTQQK